MTTDIKALYQAVERVEHHTATKQHLLDILRAGHRNAPHESQLRARLAREIEREVAEVGALHAERDLLRLQIADLRSAYDARGWRSCTVCEEYKPKHAFGPDVRSISGLQAQCRRCRADWIRARRKRL